MRSLMVAFVRGEAQAEDLTQEAFCRAFQHADTYAARGYFVAWLKRIAVNLAKDYLRRQGQARGCRSTSARRQRSRTIGSTR